MKRFPHAHHKFLSVGLALVLAAWWPLCCCLMSEAKAAGDAGSGEQSPRVVQPDGHSPGCHSHGDATHSDDEQAPAPGPCECPQLVVEHLTTFPELLLSLDRGRDLVDLSLLPLSDLVALTSLIDPEHPPSWLQRDMDWPRVRSAPSLLALRTSLTL